MGVADQCYPADIYAVLLETSIFDRSLIAFITAESIKLTHKSTPFDPFDKLSAHLYSEVKMLLVKTPTPTFPHIAQSVYNIAFHSTRSYTTGLSFSRACKLQHLAGVFIFQNPRIFMQLITLAGVVLPRSKPTARLVPDLQWVHAYRFSGHAEGPYRAGRGWISC